MSRPRGPLDRFRKRPERLWTIRFYDIPGRRADMGGRRPEDGYRVADALMLYLIRERGLPKRTAAKQICREFGAELFKGQGSTAPGSRERHLCDRYQRLPRTGLFTFEERIERRGKADKAVPRDETMDRDLDGTYHKRYEYIPDEDN